MAIDAALGFSDAFLALAARRQTVDQSRREIQIACPFPKSEEEEVK